MGARSLSPFRAPTCRTDLSRVLSLWLPVFELSGAVPMRLWVILLSAVRGIPLPLRP